MSDFNYERTLRLSKRSLTKVIGLINSILTKTASFAHVNEIRVSLDELSSEYDNYKKIIEKGIELVDEDEDTAEDEYEAIFSERDEMTSSVLSVRGKAQTYIRQFEGNRNRDSLNSSFTTNATESSGIKLPKIDLPVFDGKIENFLDFWALFENLVHDEGTIPKVKKLAYLKKSCSGEPLDRIKDLPLTEAGYDEAISSLLDAYKDMKSIIRHHFDTLFSTSRIKSAKEVPMLLATIGKSLKGLEACGEKTKNWSSLISYIVSERLDEATFIEFEKSLVTNTVFPPWDLLRTFLENISSISKRKSDPVKQHDTNKPKRNVSSNSFTAVGDTIPEKQGKLRCPICNQAHLLINCNNFKAKTPRQRFELLKPKSVCRNCFNSNHTTSNCSKPPRCAKCKQSHHTLLHFETDNDEKDSKASEVADSTGNKVASVAVTQSSSSMLSIRSPIILLPTAVVKFVSGSTSGEMRVLLDSCSQLNLISRSFVSRMKIPTRTNEFTQKVSGISGAQSICNHVAQLSIESQVEQFKFEVLFNVMDTPLPYSVQNLQLGSLCHDLSKYRLADPAYYTSTVTIDSIDALLGIEAYNRCVRGGVVNFQSLCLRDTALGWTLSSSGIPDTVPVRSNSTALCCGLTTDVIDQRLQRFWEIESIPETQITSSEAADCDNHFNQTVSRDETGKFVVRHPFKRDPLCVVGNYDQAVLYNQRIERRLTKDVARLYTEFMNEYIDLGHMTAIPNADVLNRYFIPHHAVLKPSSTTTQLRVVFNASFKSHSGLSLNDILMVGPVIQPELFDHLLRIRRYKYAISGDITKMYRCVLVHKADRLYQSIVWQNTVYELNTVTYGTAPASYQATKCLAKLADDYESIDPQIAAAIRSCFYMDDWLYGSSSISDVIRIRQIVHDVLAGAGFLLRKYQSNSNEVLDTISPNLIETKLYKSFGDIDSLSILGLSWVPTIDIFQLKTDFKIDMTVVTKRLILSTISKLFDPLGFASPVTIRGKILFQQLWKLNLSWDDVIPPDIAETFLVYINDLKAIQQLSIPRFVGNSSDDRIVGFSDASERAYCAVVYVVSRNEEGKFVSTLYCAKTRVAPVKSLTIPQLELTAALLLSDLVDRVQRTTNVAEHNVYLFSDSMIVLAWLARPPSEWKLFVRNRISKITAKFPARHWSHVDGKSNPADLATRGLTTDQLRNSSLWFSGPDFITQDEISKSEHRDVDVDMYLAKPKAVTFSSTIETHDDQIIQSYSSFSKLVRVYATVRVVCIRWRSKAASKPSAQVTVDDILFAEQYLIRTVQRTVFAEDYHRLSSDNLKLCKRSRLRCHLPFLDENGIIRSSTRIQNADVSYDRKNPIILPAQCHFTTLYVRYVHEKYFHATRPFLYAYFSVRFIFIGGLNRVIKFILKSCITCCRYSQRSSPQLMADLPIDRVQPKSPFEITGVDFAGPFSVKCTYHRTPKYAKAYASIFICFITRAVHIELTPSLSTEDFLNALKSFVSRRGVPLIIHSDNGTNFKGANRHLNLADSTLSKYAEEKRIVWKFNPPYTPHRGGLWEAAVKSAKRYLITVTDGQNFTYNSLRVFLTEIEGILNARPIAYTKTAETVEEVLTPGHFLIGRNIAVLPEPANSMKSVPLSARYRANQQRLKDFWKLWSLDYMNQLRCRAKWSDKQPNPIEGQIVLYKQPNTASFMWPIARIEKVFCDRNDVVRTVQIRVKGQIKVVPTIHLIYLPIGDRELS